MQKNVLKHQFENFSTASNESLDKAYDRFQKLISQLEVHGAPISKEDINQKFLRSLPSSWNQIALIMRNKPDIDEIDIDDLYNNLRVYEDELKSLLLLSQPTTSPKLRMRICSQMMERTENSGPSMARKGHFARECRSGRSQEKILWLTMAEQMQPTNESSSQALVAQDGLGGYDWSNNFEVEPVNYALMAISSSSLSSSSDSKVQQCSKCLKSFKCLQKNYDTEKEKHNKAKLEIRGYEIALESLESMIIGHEKNELAWGKTNYANTKILSPSVESSWSNPKINIESVIIEDWTSMMRKKWSPYMWQRPVSTARPSINTARPVSTASPNISIARPGYASRSIYPRMDNVRPRGSCSPIKRSYYTKPAFRPKDLKQDVKTFGVKNMTTAGKRAVVNTGKGKLDTDLKKSRWVWRPKGNYLDHVSKDNGSFMLKKGNPEILLQDHAVVDSGCSSHMTGNKAYLSDYEDYNGGFVAFGSDPKGGSSGKDKGPTQEYIMLLLQPHRTRIPVKDVVQIAHVTPPFLHIAAEANQGYHFKVVIAQEKTSENASSDKDVPRYRDAMIKKNNIRCKIIKRICTINLESWLIRNWCENLWRIYQDQSFEEEKGELHLKRRQLKLLATSLNTCDLLFEKKDIVPKWVFKTEDIREALLVKQQPDGIFISQDKYVADILKKFDFCSIKTATTPIESNKPLVKDEDGVEVDVHEYRSMIGSLMYLTASRPDIMFVVLCLCKNSDYAEPVDRKSTTGGCQFLGRRLISWQCKKQTIMANSTTEAEYVAAAHCCGQVLWIQNQMMDYGFNFMNTKSIMIKDEHHMCSQEIQFYHLKTECTLRFTSSLA
ncbi:hypothetical protein Tco_0251755 [Tanacetum coccineum]